MTKTPDEIKKGLECCHVGHCDCEECPYEHTNSCMHYLKQDALALIQQLQAENAEKDARIQQLESGLLAQADVIATMGERIKQLEAERDAAVESMRNDPHCCYHCANMTKRGICQSEPRADGHCFEWRGVQKEDAHEQ